MRYEILKEKEKIVIEALMTDKGIINSIPNLPERISESFINVLVYNENKLIGFINLSTESTNDFVFMDLFLIKEEQNKGYGKIITKDFIEKFKDKKEILIAYTKTNNKRANKVLFKTGSLVMKFDETNYYSLSDNIKLTENKLNKLVEHRYYGKDNKKTMGKCIVFKK